MGEDVCAGWLERTGLEQWRALLDERGAPRAGLLRVPMGQYFGGRVVGMTGLSGVAVSLAGRGQGQGHATWWRSRCVNFRGAVDRFRYAS